MARKKKYTQTLVLPLTDEQMQWLNDEAERMAIETGVSITKNDIARKAFDTERRKQELMASLTRKNQDK